MKPTTPQQVSVLSADRGACSRAWAEIHLGAVAGNLTAIRSLTARGTKVMAVVKADAYGHGLVPVATVAQAAGAEWLGVATVAEGSTLREAGLTVPIALLCGFAPEEANTLVDNNITPSIGDSEALAAITHAVRRSECKTPYAIHLDIDTGIGRAGIQPQEAVSLWQAATNAGLHVSGLCTHFADADGAEDTFSRQQEALFEQTYAALRVAGAQFDLIHLSNSPATLRTYGLTGNLVRPGLLLYGIAPRNTHASTADNLTPILTLKARVAAVRELDAGQPISYGMTHRLQRKSRVATVLIGYGDGYPRRLSNCGRMLLHGQYAPILGRVCMDQTVIDVTDIPAVMAGDTAVCIGQQDCERITVSQIASLIDATEHEITTCLLPRIPRLYLS